MYLVAPCPRSLTDMLPVLQGASEAFDMVYSGGKLDDITVLVCLIGDILPGSP